MSSTAWWQLALSMFGSGIEKTLWLLEPDREKRYVIGVTERLHVWCVGISVYVCRTQRQGNGEQCQICLGNVFLWPATGTFKVTFDVDAGIDNSWVACRCTLFGFSTMQPLLAHSILSVSLCRIYLRLYLPYSQVRPHRITPRSVDKWMVK